MFFDDGVDVKLARVTSGKDPCDLVVAEGAEAFESVISGAVGRWNINGTSFRSGIA